MIASTNKCVLVVDGNWLLQSRMFVMGDCFAIGQDDYTNAQRKLQMLLSQSLIGTINQLRCVTDVVLVADGGSWRKELERPVVYQIEYKGNRHASEDKNWDAIWSAFNDWLERCRKIGMTVSQSRGAEGDDWIAYWTNYFYNRNIDSIIWSTDHDLWQLITHKDDGTFVAAYEKKMGVVLDRRFDTSDVSLFEQLVLMPEDSTNMIWLKNNIEQKTYIEPKSVTMSKVIIGDAGDNVLSIVTKPYIDKNGKTIIRKVTNTDWNKCQEELHIDYNNFLEKKTDIVDYLLTLKRYADYNREAMLSMFDFNIKLVTLSMDIIPQSLFENAEFKSDFDINNIKNNFMLLCKDDDTTAYVEELPF